MMTKPRISPTRELFGIIGKISDRSSTLKTWNAHFKKQGRDAFMDYYPTTIDTLPERLSEMFHFDRRGYIVSSDLSDALIPLLDDCDGEKVDTVINHNGILHGVFVGCDNTDVAARLSLWNS